ncbi:MAG TPA: hypothetical protein VK797_23280 [Tepidisphaeraceae bacterium]|jgi:hypothetical protein|nr:hypothetical protein [Tepidisphaeraceae bacterium]
MNPQLVPISQPQMTTGGDAALAPTQRDFVQAATANPYRQPPCDRELPALKSSYTLHPKPRLWPWVTLYVLQVAAVAYFHVKFWPQGLISGLIVGALWGIALSRRSDWRKEMRSHAH